jgi:hypothetical protein
MRPVRSGALRGALSDDFSFRLNERLATITRPIKP